MANIRLPLLLEGAPPVLWHYTSELGGIVRKGSIRARDGVSLTEITPGSVDLKSLPRQGVNTWFGLKVDSSGLDLEPFKYDPADAGRAYDSVKSSWVDEKEWVCASDVPLSAVLSVWVNPDPDTTESAVDWIPKKDLRKIGTDAARMVANIDHAGSPRPTPDETYSLLVDWCELLGLPVEGDYLSS